jgi:hypothetical protein
VQIGQSVLASRNVGPHPDTDAPDFILDVPRASSGAAVGAYVGYGWTLGNVRLGGEMDADLTSTYWIIDRVIPVPYAYFSGSAAGVARPDFSRSLCSGKPLMLISCLKKIVQYSRAWRSRR